MAAAAASCARVGAVSTTLRGVTPAEPPGVEEVGEQIEHYPPPNWDGMQTPSRRVLMERQLEGMDGAEEEEVHDPYVGMLVAGNLIEDVENDTGLYDWEEDDERKEDKSYDPPIDSVMVSLSPHSNEMSLLADRLPFPLSQSFFSTYLGSHPNPTLSASNCHINIFCPSCANRRPLCHHDRTPVQFESNDLRVDVHDRRTGDATCTDSQGEVSISVKTDNYGYETKWKIVNSAGTTIASGPPSGTNYADSKIYTGSWCLSSGTYQVVVQDTGGDGMCRGDSSQGWGCGYFKVQLNGVNVGQVVQDKQNWEKKSFQVSVVPMSSRIDVVDTGSSSGGWCDRVKSVMRVPSGTCTLPDGSRGHRVRVTTKVDKYGEETSWRITSNGVVRMKMAAIVPSNSAKAVEDCLPPGDYNFQINDPDGLCCRHGQGGYQIIVDGQGLFNGGAFVTSEGHKFKLGHDWMSPMSERDCEWWWAHNYRRMDWHTRCTDHYCDKNARHLRWSSSLEAHARDYAGRLLDTCDETGIKHDVTDQGENLAKNKGGGSWGALYPADNIVKRFVDNEEYWGWNANAHLTQAMWYSSRYVGCAESVKTMSDGTTCRMQVCRYAKAGNCQMNAYQSSTGNRWMLPMMDDDSPCGPMCPPSGCVSLSSLSLPVYVYCLKT